jgi:hypothetical protein
MSNGKIPIEVAQSVGEERGLDMVVLLAFDHETGMQHVVSWGRTKEDCAIAAKSAAWAKAALGFEGFETEPCAHGWHRCPRCGAQDSPAEGGK